MSAVYLFSVVLGGGLLLLSLLGNIFGTDAVDVEIDVDVEGPELEDGSASKILSIRTLTYTLFGFGAVGWLMGQFGAVAAAPSTIAYSAVGGIISGTLVNRAFAYLKRTESGLTESDDSFMGLAGRITLPLGGGSAGSVAVERGARRHTLRALPHPSATTGAPPEEWENVVVVEMKEGVAYVAPSDEDLNALP